MKKYYLAFGLIVIAAAFLRLFHNIDIALWHDEAFSALLIKYSWREMMYRIGLDVHPPMYYIFLRFWSEIFGTSLLALRGFSVFFGVATGIAGYLFVKQAFKHRGAALLTLLLIAINPFQLQYALEARMYTFGAFFAVLAAYFLSKALEIQKRYANPVSPDLVIAPTSRHKNTAVLYYTLFALSIGIIILTHYYLLFTAAALCFYALCFHIYNYKWDIKKYGLLLASYILIVLCFLPWTKAFLFQYKQVGAGYWIPPMDFWSIPTTIWEMLFRLSVDISRIQGKILILAGVAFTIFFFAWILKKITRPEKWLVFLAFLAPFGGAILFAILAKIKGETSSVYLVRYFLYTSTFYIIGLALWFSSIQKKAITYIIVIAYCGANLWAFNSYWKNLQVAKKPGMEGVIALLRNNFQPGDKLFVGSSFEFFNLKYYVQKATTPPDSILNNYIGSRAKYTLAHISSPLLFSGGNRTIDNMPHYAGTAILTNEDLVPDFAEATKSGDRVWLVWTNGFGGTKPTTPTNWEQLDEKGYADVHPYDGTWVIVTEYLVK